MKKEQGTRLKEQGARKKNQGTGLKGQERSKNVDSCTLCLKPYPYIASDETGFQNRKQW